MKILGNWLIGDKAPEQFLNYLEHPGWFTALEVQNPIRALLLVFLEFKLFSLLFQVVRVFLSIKVKSSKQNKSQYLRILSSLQCLLSFINWLFIHTSAL